MLNVRCWRSKQTPMLECGTPVLTRSGSRVGQNAVMHNAAFPRLRGLFGKQRALALDAPAIA